VVAFCLEENRMSISPPKTTHTFIGVNIALQMSNNVLLIVAQTLGAIIEAI